jgi:hypothetical protein
MPRELIFAGHCCFSILLFEIAGPVVVMLDGLFEVLDAFAQTLGEIRDFASPEQQDEDDCDYDDFRAAKSHGLSFFALTP